MIKCFFIQNSFIHLHPQNKTVYSTVYLGFIHIDSNYTNNNTPSMPLFDAHLEGFLFL